VGGVCVCQETQGSTHSTGLPPGIELDVVRAVDYYSHLRGFGYYSRAVIATVLKVEKWRVEK